MRSIYYKIIIYFVLLILLPYAGMRGCGDECLIKMNTVFEKMSGKSKIVISVSALMTKIKKNRI